MLLKKVVRPGGTVAARLTLWYTCIFSLSVLFTFSSFFLMARSAIRDQCDHDLFNELKEFSIINDTGGVLKVKEEIFWEAASEGVGNIFIRLFSLEDAEIAATDMASWQGIPDAGESLEKLRASGKDYIFETFKLREQSFGVRAVTGYIGKGFIVQFGELLKDDKIFVDNFIKLFTPGIIILIIIAAFTGWFMAKRALSGVEEVTITAVQISDGSFDRRVKVKSRGLEIERLANAFNAMLDRLHKLFNEMKEMNNNIAHDLRSPLARMRGSAEMALTTVTSLEENKAFAASIIEDCDHLLGMINTMLDIAEAESGVMELRLEQVNITAVIKKACDLFLPVAEDHTICLTTRLSSDCFVFGDSPMLQRMVGNLLDNALKFTPPDGVVTISAMAEKEHIGISVQDTGIGIAEKELPYIFNKFYRCDSSRAHHGSGLGLSLVKAIVSSHNGSITVSSIPGKGSTFSIKLPKFI